MAFHIARLLLFFCGVVAQAQNEARGRVEGKTVDAITKAPLRKATISLMGGADGRGGGTAVTDAAGNFVFDKLPAGTYRLSAEKTGYVRSSYGARSAMSPGTPITLGERDEKKGLLILLTPQGALNGRIIDEDGDPLEGVQISIQRRMSIEGILRLTPSRQTQTNDRGEFRLSGIVAGKYFVTAFHQRFGMGGAIGLGSLGTVSSGYVPTYYPGVERIEEAQAIDIAAGQEISSFNMTLRKSKVYRVRGRFTGGKRDGDQQQSPIQAMLRPKTSAEEAFGAGIFGIRSVSLQLKEGSFEIAGVIPGRYTLEIMDYANRGPRTMGRLGIVVSDGDLDGLEVPEIQVGSLTGVLKLENETKPINLQGIRVSLFLAEPGMGMNQNIERKEDNRFEAKDISPEKWRLSVMTGGEPIYVKSIRAGGREVPGGVFDLSAGGAPEVEVLLSGAVGKIEGSIERSAPELAMGVVRVMREGLTPNEVSSFNGRTAMAMVDSSGKFSIANLGPGDYRVYALEEFNAEMGDADMLKRFESKAQKVRLAEGESKTITLKQISWEELNKVQQ